jgi:predicted lipoprotein with Yx(FWY)xxD motif
MVQIGTRARWRVAGLLGLTLLALSSLSVSLGISPARGQSAAATVLVAQNPTLGPMLTDPQGMTLYMRTSDPPGGSSCTGGCATTWPPLIGSADSLVLPDGATGTLATFTRDDGSQQVTYNGMALYHYQRDAAVGDTTGQGVGGVWFIVAP